MESVAELVRGAALPQLDDLSMRRLRQRLLANADAALKSPAAAGITRSKFVVAVALPALFAGSLALRPRAGDGSSTKVAAPTKATVVVSPIRGPVRDDAVVSDEPADVRAPQAAAELGQSTSLQDVPKNASARATPPAGNRRAKSPLAGAAAPPAATTESGVAEEDLAYLQIRALLVEGRTEEAVLAARSYLARFPDGFRRPEVRTIATSR